MMEKITWGDYWLTIGIVFAIYETLIMLLFFRKDFLQLALKIGNGNQKVNGVQRSQQQKLFTPFMPDPNTTGNIAGEKENEIVMPQVHELMQSIKSFINDVAERSFIKEEVIMGLQIILREHKNLVGSNFQKSINEVISVECQNNCSIHFNAEELNILWLG